MWLACGEGRALKRRTGHASTLNGLMPTSRCIRTSSEKD
jgi:hypothetical protein